MSLARTEEPQGTTPYRLVGGVDPKGRKSLVGSLGEMRVGAPAPNQNLRELDHRNARHPSRGGEETSPPRNEARTLVSLSPPGANAPGPSRRGGSEDPDTCWEKRHESTPGKKASVRETSTPRCLKKNPMEPPPGMLPKERGAPGRGKPAGSGMSC